MQENPKVIGIFLHVSITRTVLVPTSTAQKRRLRDFMTKKLRAQHVNDTVVQVIFFHPHGSNSISSVLFISTNNFLEFSTVLFPKSTAASKINIYF